MTLLPEILVGGFIGWVCLAIMSAYYFGKMKGSEPTITYDNQAERENIANRVQDTRESRSA